MFNDKKIKLLMRIAVFLLTASRVYSYINLLSYITDDYYILVYSIELFFEIGLGIVLLIGKKNAGLVFTFAIYTIYELFAMLGEMMTSSSSLPVINAIGSLILMCIVLIYSIPAYQDKRKRANRLFWLPAMCYLITNIMINGINIYDFIYPMVYLIVSLWIVKEPTCIKENHKQEGGTNYLSVLYTIIGLIIFAVTVGSIIDKPKKTNSWDKLSDQEKQWYNDNYGNGKMDDINNAIEEYKNDY